MYTIVFIAVFLAIDYLWRTHKVLAYRVASALAFAAGFVLMIASAKDQRWHSAVIEMYAALIIVGLVELYMKLGRFEVKTKK